MAVAHYRELIAWQKSMELTTAVYAVTRKFPREEIYGLSNQLRRCAVSIPSNIAEGQGRQSAKEFSHFLRIAAGSLQECETQLLIAQSLSYIAASEVEPILSLADEVGRIIRGLNRSLF